MNILLYLLVWAAFLTIGYLLSEKKENKQLKAQLAKKEKEEFPRRFRWITV